MRCYTRPSLSPKVPNVIRVHRVLGDPNSDLISIHTNNGNLSLNINNQGLVPQGNRCGIVRFNDIYYLAFYTVLEDTNEYDWWYLDEDGDYNALGTTPAF